MFWCKTISGNDFTPHLHVWLRMENKIFQKSISVDRVFYGFDSEIGLHFYFHYKLFPGLRRAKREREREERVTDSPKTDRTPAPAPPYISHHHRDRITTEDRSTEDRITPDQSHPTEIASPLKTDPPKTDLIGLVVTHDRSHRPWPMTDLSLSLNFWSLSLPPSLSLTELWSLTNGVVLIFVFLSLYIEIFYYKICLVAEKMGEKIQPNTKKHFLK